jgi:hypothetical protein
MIKKGDSTGEDLERLKHLGNQFINFNCPSKLISHFDEKDESIDFHLENQGLKGYFDFYLYRGAWSEELEAYCNYNGKRMEVPEQLRILHILIMILEKAIKEKEEESILMKDIDLLEKTWEKV